MDRYYEITPQSMAYSEYFDWWNNYKEICEIAKNFMTEYEIESNQFCARPNAFYIIPSENDKIKFSNMLCKNDIGNGLIMFKKKSKIGKAWINKNVEVQSQPMINFEYFTQTLSGKMRLFHDPANNKIYYSIETKYDFDETPEGFIEMKASEFFKVIEDIESR